MIVDEATDLVGRSAAGRREPTVLRSKPAQNALSPAPVMTATYESLSSRKSCHAATSSDAVGGSTQFMTSGRLIVM